MIARSCIFVFCLMQMMSAQAGYPTATGDTSLPECIDALKLAKARYQSAAPRLYGPLTIPEEFQSRLVLGATALDISAGDALTSSGEFEKVPHGLRSVYWAKETHGARRIVVKEIPFGWRGDQYDVYLLDAAVSQEDFLAHTNESVPANHRYEPVIRSSWRPPLVFQRGEHEAMWFIDVGEPFLVLPDWRVHSSRHRNAICTISFRPRGKEPMDLLPRPVVALARKLDEALGPGNNEGTLRPTARIRNNTEHVLANAALRPWALANGNAYNSRSEVDAGLERWAEVNNSRRRLHREIRKLYPSAERSLAGYYIDVYGLEPKEAQESAEWVIDLVFRSFFVFPIDRADFTNNNLSANPWPQRQ